MSITDRIKALAEPIASEHEVDLVDVEHLGDVIRVTIDRQANSEQAGLDIDVISKVTRALNRAIDEADPVPGRYTLEVSSPGLERPLRTPEHFQRAVGSVVNLKTRADVEGERRIKGLLAAADPSSIVVRDPDSLEERTLSYDQIEKARTVFEWGPAPKPGAGKNQRKKASSR